MSEILSQVTKFKDKFKIRLDKVYIENHVFRLYSTVTVAIFFVCGGLVTMQTYLGKHIECILPPKEDVRQNALNQYCFIMSTYTLPHLYNQSIGEDVSHFGVGPHDPTKDHQKYHSYYQWVPFALFFQALVFMLPHLCWKSLEAGRIKSYCDLELVDKVSLKGRSLSLYKKKDSDGDKMINKAAMFFKMNLSHNNKYAMYYILCEVLNFVIVVANIFLTDAFLGYEFSKYGHQVINFVADDPENRVDPMNKVFPKVAKCDFQKFGPSGNIIRYDIMCVLALNIINEKIYVFLWFWFIFLAICGGLNIIYRTVVLCGVKLRNHLIRRNIPREYEHDVHVVFDNLNYGDWFLLKRISDNINRIRFGELIQEILKAIRDVSVQERLSDSHKYSHRNEFESDKLLDPNDNESL